MEFYSSALYSAHEKCDVWNGPKKLAQGNWSFLALKIWMEKINLEFPILAMDKFLKELR